MISKKQNRLSACLGFSSPSEFEEVKSIVFDFVWPEKDLQWLDGKNLTGIVGCGFQSADAYEEFTQSTQHFPDWAGTAGKLTHLFTCSFEHTLQKGDDSAGKEALADAFLEWLRPFLPEACGARVLLITKCPRPPIQTYESIVDLAVEPADITSVFYDRGIAVMPNELSYEDVSTLQNLAKSRIALLDAQLKKEGCEDQVASSKMRFAEICSRGRFRWDMLLHADGESVGGVDDPQFESDFLTRICTESAWIPAVSTLLGENYTWQVSLIVSRPGAPAGGWHADGGHSRYNFSGSSALIPYALCVFIPVVDLVAPERVDGKIVHGSGCTAFWPGSHRYPACLHMGSAAASTLEAVIPGAPLQAGSALMYDYRLVHAGSPNDGEERPILQITYCRNGYVDREKNYGYEQLFY